MVSMQICILSLCVCVCAPRTEKKKEELEIEKNGTREEYEKNYELNNLNEKKKERITSFHSSIAIK